MSISVRLGEVFGQYGQGGFGVGFGTCLVHGSAYNAENSQLILGIKKKKGSGTTVSQLLRCIRIDRKT